MANLVVVGGQWGDEGKGKIVDLLCPQFAHVVRFNGGNNAGHTVRFTDRHFALHLVPSGILQPDCSCHVGPGVVIDPIALLEEIVMLEAASISVRSRLQLSSRAHLVLPGHRALDRARESRRGAGKLGTTGRGIGPAYESRAARSGVRLGLVRHPSRFREAMRVAEAELEASLAGYPDDRAPDPTELDAAIEAALALAPMVGEISSTLGDASGPILFEGAQGTMLDLDHGSYPFVTSSSCLAGSAAPLCGLPAATIEGVLGVFKAYATRVGSGPFPTELSEGTGEHLRRRGSEFGTTTGRPRRTGWFDALAARAAMRWNGIKGVALTKLDVLDEMDEIQIAVGYRLGDRAITEIPDDVEDLALVEPVFEQMPGWHTDTSGCTSFDKLPHRARAYIARIEELLGAPIVIVSRGPRREETIFRNIEPIKSWIPGLFA